MTEIMLAKGFDESRLEYPVEVSIKLDGVAADFFKTEDGWQVQSRQGKPIESVGHLVAWMNKYYPAVDVGTHLVGELTVMGVEDFKDAAGIIRRKQTDTRIRLFVYDCFVEPKHRSPYSPPYSNRIRHIEDIIGTARDEGVFARYRKDCTVVQRPVQRVPVCGVANNRAELQRHLDSLPKLVAQSPVIEGFIIRNLGGKDSIYEQGKRTYGMMKYKAKPSLDLEVVSFEERTANKSVKFLGEEFEPGQGLRAVGRINVEYNGRVVGVGAGSMTHEEARNIWERYTRAGLPDMRGSGLIAEVEYMHDPSYDALRQPVFKRWRADKDTPSLEA